MSAIPGYKDSSKCWLESNNGECCCKCIHRMEVFGHPWHFKTLHDSLGFYVCTAFDAMDHDRVAMIAGKHGACECFQKIEEGKGKT